MLQGDNGIQIFELRMAGVKIASQDLTILLKGIQSSNSLQCLKLSKLQINDPVLVRELIKGIKALPELRELTLSYQGFLAIQLNEIMQIISESFPKLAFLNLSGNPLPIKENRHSEGFIQNLLKLIEKSERLADLDLSDMNLRDKV